MPDDRISTTYDYREHYEQPPSYEDATSTSRLAECTAIRDDGRIDLDLNSSIYKVLAQRLSVGGSGSGSLDRKSNDLQESTHGEQASNTQHLAPRTVPALNIVIQVVGSRGDVQPFVALGNELRRHGHRVRLATHDTFANFVRSSNLDFYPIGGDPAELMAYMVKNPGLIPSMKSLKGGDIQRKRKMVAEMLRGCWNSCTQPDPVTGTPFVANAIIANPPSFAHIHCAQALSVPVHLMFTMPWSNTRAFPHPLANIITRNNSLDPEVVNFVSYSVVEWMTWQGLGDVINEWRATIDLEPISTWEGPNLARTLGIPFTYCWSPALVPRPADWPPYIDVCGFFFRSAPDYSPDSDLKLFLENGPPPIYIGFGSIVIDDPDQLTNILLSAIKKSGVRAIISKGWSNLGRQVKQDFQDQNVLFLGDCPHEWLFQHVAAVIHHGGAGTTACGLLNARPTLIVPFFGDQPFWGAMVGAAGAGPMPIPYKRLTCERLGEAIEYCLTQRAMEAAQGLALKMRTETGVASAVESFHKNLPTENLACDLIPSEPAVWTYKTSTRVLKLSNLAAEVLCDGLRITRSRLKMHEINVLVTEPTRWDPITGSASATMKMYTDVLQDTVDIVRKPVKVYQRSRIENSSAITKDKNLVEMNNTQRVHDDDGYAEQSPMKKMQERPSFLAPAASQSASAVGKLLGHFTRSVYVEVPVALSEGLRAVPKLYGGTVRDHGRVKDWKTGFSKAGRNAVYGFADGVSDLWKEPIAGGKKEGSLGVAKGVGKGVLSFTTKIPSAALGIYAYAGQGICKSIRMAAHASTRETIVEARHAEGRYQFSNVEDREGLRVAVLVVFKSLM